MTVANLFAKHRAGEVSKEKFLYEVRKDAQLPYISNLTSYDDAIRILKQKSVIKEARDHDYDYEPINRREPVDVVDDQDDFDSTDYLEFTDGDDVVSLYRDGGKWIEGDIVVGEKPYGWGSKTYMGYLRPKEIARYLSKDYGGKWSSYEGMEETADTEGKYNVVLTNGEKYNNVTFTNMDSFKTEDGKTMLHQQIKSSKKAGGLNEADSSEVKIGNTYEYSMAPGDTLTVDSIDGDDMKVTTLQKGKKYNGEETKSWVEQAIRLGLLKLKEGKSPKKVIKEQEDLHLAIDRLNPILVNKAVNVELAKLPEINAAIYQKTLEKVVAKLKKDPRCYDDVLVANAKEINKVDEKRKMIPVKKELKDQHHQMKSPKGVEKHKANTKASKTENKKGKPKGVKEMSSHAKGHKGMKHMKQPEKKHKVMEAIESFLKKKLTEDSHHVYGVGMGVKTPDGPGTIKAIVGSTLTVELENGKHKDYQMNIINHFSGHHDKSSNELDDAKIKKYDPKADPKKETMDEKKERVIKKVMEFLKKKKKGKKEIDELTTQDAQNFRTGKTPGTPNVKVGSSDERIAKQAGITYTSYK